VRNFLDVNNKERVPWSQWGSWPAYSVPTQNSEIISGYAVQIPG